MPAAVGTENRQVYTSSGYVFPVAVSNYVGINNALQPNLEGTAFANGDGIFEGMNVGIRGAKIRDGFSNTILIAERAYNYRKAGLEINSEAGNSYVSPGTNIANAFGYDRGSGATTATVANGINFTLPQPNSTDAITAYHPGGANIGFADGSVKFIAEIVSPVTLQQLGAKADGTVIVGEY